MVEEVGGAVVLRAPQVADSPMLNRAVGLGVNAPATEEDVDAVVQALAGTTFYVAVAPSALPRGLPAWLAARGLEPGWGWMTFRRGIDDPPTARTELRLEEVQDQQQARTFARVVCVGYGLPGALESVIARAPEAGWICWLAMEGDEPASAAGLYVADGIGYLGFAATLPEHRGKGAQGALLAARIRRAAELRCDTVITETGELQDQRPSNSYRNILRSGFEEVAVTANWLGHT
ncbi:MAG: GNAT family N-acetyltransferase [Thermoleophilia bacterium]|nr:GNAT family N-acetyltransferase [Thermoleophilia bacterium]MDH5281205.1 GNAT family N-acetyltransferase [Thermoleophilia bacterium]